MADKVSKFIFPVKSGDTVTDKEFDLPSGGSFDGDYNSLTNKPTLGTAAAKDVPSSGNASSSQVVMGNDSRLSNSRPASDVPSWAKSSTKPTYTASEVGAIATSAKGTANGVAELDSSGKVPSSQLPSYVDDVLEYDSQSVFPSTGETGKIYVAKDTNKSYRWTGSAYSQIKGDLALGETSSTAYRGDRGKVAYDHSQSEHARTDATKTEASSTNGNIKINGTETNVYTHPGSGTNPHGTTKSDVGLGNVGNFKAVSTAASQGLSDTEKSNARANIGAGTSSLTLGTTSSTAAKGDHNHDDRYYTEAEENQIIEALQSTIVDSIYPVGSLYMSINSTMPSFLTQGKTWELLSGNYVLKTISSGTGGQTSNAGNTGSTTLTAAQSGVPAHSHGLNSHTHTVGAHSHGLNSHTHTMQHDHKYGVRFHSYYGAMVGLDNWGLNVYNYASGSSVVEATLVDSPSVPVNTGIVSTSRSLKCDERNSTGYTGKVADAGSGANTGAASGSTANSSAFSTGAASGSTANNTAAKASEGHTHTAGMPQNIGVYVWKRTA